MTEQMKANNQQVPLDVSHNISDIGPKHDTHPSPLFIKYSCGKNAIPFNSLDCYALFITGMGNINFRNQFSSQM